MNKTLFFLSVFTALLLFSCGNDDEIKKEEKFSAVDSITKTSLPSAADSGEITSGKERIRTKASAKKQEETPFKNMKIDIEIFNNDTINQEPKYTGYGYNILIENGAQKIHQPHKPAVPGIQGFKSVADAKKIAELVVRKIRNNSMPPVVTSHELDSLGILK